VFSGAAALGSSARAAELTSKSPNHAIRIHDIVSALLPHLPAVFG
jgi:hypothetical protein